MFFKASILPCGLTLCLMLLGCGGGPDDQPEVGAVTGVVTVDGQPQANLQVVFTPDEGRPSQGITDESGRYVLNYLGEVNGAKVGKHKVQITTMQVSESDRAEDQKPFKESIPAEYNQKTTLGADVQPGENTFDFAVQTK